MTKAEKQKYFNKAVKGLAKQKFERSYATWEGCMYRGPNGLRCAIGHLIPNSRYDEAEEGNSADTKGVMKMIGVRYSKARANFFTSLQECHDADNDMECRLIMFAEAHGLDVPSCLVEAA